MGKNPLRELLNKLKYDSLYSQLPCYIEYKDVSSANGVGRTTLAACAIESRNILLGDTIIPFHRIIKVVCGNDVMYPFK